jgi:hypothetical protein
MTFAHNSLRIVPGRKIPVLPLIVVLLLAASRRLPQLLLNLERGKHLRKLLLRHVAPALRARKADQKHQ